MAADRADRPRATMRAFRVSSGRVRPGRPQPRAGWHYHPCI